MVRGLGSIAGRYQDGAQSDWITEDEARDGFSPLQLDVFPASWELYHPEADPRPPGEPTRGEREVESRERALDMVPRGTEVGRAFTDAEGRSKTFKAKVYDYCARTGGWSTPTEIGKNLPSGRWNRASESRPNLHLLLEQPSAPPPP